MPCMAFTSGVGGVVKRQGCTVGPKKLIHLQGTQKQQAFKTGRLWREMEGSINY